MMKTGDLNLAIMALEALLKGEDVRLVAPSHQLQASCRVALVVLKKEAAKVQDRFVLEFDGASKGNPGPSGIGIVIYAPSGEVIAKKSLAIPPTTNNMAEYQALVAGLRLALAEQIKRLTIRTDSELVAKQMRGEYRIRKAELFKFATEAHRLLEQLESYSIDHVPREQNRFADQLASQAAEKPVAIPKGNGTDAN